MVVGYWIILFCYTVDARTTLSGTRTTYNILQSVNITCTSSGAPLPTIRWTHNGSDEIPFNHTEEAVDFEVQLKGYIFLSATLTRLGIVRSTLHIQNIHYPDDEGEYACIGSNIGTRIRATSSDSFTLRVERMYCKGTQCRGWLCKKKKNASRLSQRQLWL